MGVTGTNLDKQNMRSALWANLQRILRKCSSEKHRQAIQASASCRVEEKDKQWKWQGSTHRRGNIKYIDLLCYISYKYFIHFRKLTTIKATEPFQDES